MADVTKSKPIRVHDDLWAVYGEVCAALDTNRAADLLEHMRDRIREHGTPEQRERMKQADAELAERRARKGGRPPTRTADSEE